MLTYYVIPGVRHAPNLRRVIKPDYIIGVVCRYFDVDRSIVQGRNNKSVYSVPRHISMALISKYTIMNQSDIKDLFTLKSHASVIKAIQDIEGRMKVDDRFRNIVNEIESLI